MKSPFQTWLVRLALVAAVPFFLSSCGSSYSAPTGSTTYTIGGTVSNLATGNSVVLQDNGGDNLTVSANGNFTFTKAINAGGAYAVTVSTPPSSPAQICIVSNGSGSANATVTNITVNCGHNEWAWMSGSNSPTATTIAGSYGAQGVAAASNLPTIRNFGMVSWTDGSGNLWLFGGNGNDSTGANGDLNDLWKYDTSSGQWTWVGGSKLINAADTASAPGARDSGVGWIDSSGNLWLFGGRGYDASGTFGYLNDLWEYSIAGNTWTLKGGSTVSGIIAANQPGVYGTPNVANAANIPGSRAFSTAQNINGVVWLFGGFGSDVNNSQDNLNDVWQYDISSGEWTSIGGAQIVDTVPNYGTLGTPSATNDPGARFYAASWADKSGNIWLFGGNFAGASTVVFFNDLWEYSTSGTNANEWTWKGGVQSTGDNNTDNSGDYGVQGAAAATNLPGPRVDMATWTDPSGNFWLFGGFGYDSNPAKDPSNQVDLNDLWEYSVTQNEWIWQSGMNTGDQNGVYGTLGQLAPLNIPGNREGAATWTDASGNLWLFGGSGTNAINDLWMYLP